MSSGETDYVWRNVAKQIKRGRFARYSRDTWEREVWRPLPASQGLKRGPPPMASQLPRGFRKEKTA